MINLFLCVLGCNGTRARYYYRYNGGEPHLNPSGKVVFVPHSIKPCEALVNIECDPLFEKWIASSLQFDLSELNKRKR